MADCCIIGCDNKAKKRGEVKFYLLPTARSSRPSKVKRRRLWLEAIEKANGTAEGLSHDDAQICSAHFVSGQMSLDISDQDFVPSVFPKEHTANSRRQTLRPRSGFLLETPKVTPKNKVQPKPANACEKVDKSSNIFLPENNYCEPLEDEDVVEEEETTQPPSSQVLIAQQQMIDYVNLKKPMLQIRSVIDCFGQFRCDVCHGKFPTGSALVKHKQLHEQEWSDEDESLPIVSDFVVKSEFIDKPVTTEEPSFQCNMCNRSFTTIHSLKRHKLLHVRDDRKCPQCGTMFCKRHNHVVAQPQISTETTFEEAETTGSNMNETGECQMLSSSDGVLDEGLQLLLNSNSMTLEAIAAAQEQTEPTSEKLHKEAPAITYNPRKPGLLIAFKSFLFKHRLDSIQSKKRGHSIGSIPTMDKLQPTATCTNTNAADPATTITAPITTTAAAVPITAPIKTTAAAVPITAPITTTAAAVPITAPIKTTAAIPITAPIINTAAVVPITAPIKTTAAAVPITAPIITTASAPITTSAAVPITAPITTTAAAVPITAPIKTTAAVLPITAPITTTAAAPITAFVTAPIITTAPAAPITASIKTSAAASIITASTTCMTPKPVPETASKTDALTSLTSTNASSPQHLTSKPIVYVAKSQQQRPGQPFQKLEQSKVCLSFSKTLPTNVIQDFMTYISKSESMKSQAPRLVTFTAKQDQVIKKQEPNEISSIIKLGQSQDPTIPNKEKPTFIFTTLPKPTIKTPPKILPKSNLNTTTSPCQRLQFPKQISIANNVRSSPTVQAPYKRSYVHGSRPPSPEPIFAKIKKGPWDSPIPNYPKDFIQPHLPQTPKLPPALQMFSPQFLTSAMLDVERNFEYILSE